MTRLAGLLLGLMLLVLPAPPAGGHVEGPPGPAAPLVEERIGGRLPLDLAFRDPHGRPVRLAEVFDGGTPVVLVLAYYHCGQLCGLGLRTLADGLRATGFRPGDRYRALTVSVDPRDEPYDAGRLQATVLDRLGQPDAARTWPFLVGEEPEIHALADRLGFRYRYDPATDQFAHPAVAFVLTPDGRISRYLYGVKHRPLDLRLALLEASQGRTGSPFERILMRCYRYDPATRRYGLYIAGFLKGGAALTLLALGLVLGRLWRRELGREVGP